MRRRVLWDSLPVLPAGGARHRHSTEQPGQSATRAPHRANRAEKLTPGLPAVKRGRGRTGARGFAPTRRTHVPPLPHQGELARSEPSGMCRSHTFLPR
ncbi:hypothetical protein WQ59_02625 [Streptomyces sp. KE1]|nr:hypothetical protein WQ59_02625 [Streptomyces sp. KE1]